MFSECVSVSYHATQHFIRGTINPTEAQVKIFLLLQELVNFLLPGICSSLMLDFEVCG